MKYTLLFLFLPVLSFSQNVFIAPGLMASNRTGETEAGFLISSGVTLNNEALSFTAKISRSTIQKVNQTYFQYCIGPRFKNFTVGLTFDYAVLNFEQVRTTEAGLGFRAAGSFTLIDRLSLLVDFSTGINGYLDNYAMLSFGLSYSFDTRID